MTPGQLIDYQLTILEAHTDDKNKLDIERTVSADEAIKLLGGGGVIG